jgi:hypothetical protein
MTLRVADWIARVLVVGWLGTIVIGFVMPGGHPPLVFPVAYGVILTSFVLAPIGITAASVKIWQARRDPLGVPRRTLAILGVNVLFLLVALALLALFFVAARHGQGGGA